MTDYDPTYHYPIQPRTDGVPSPPVVAPPEAVGAPAGADGTAGGQGLDGHPLGLAATIIVDPDGSDELAQALAELAALRSALESVDYALTSAGYPGDDRFEAIVVISERATSAEWERDAARSRLAETEIDLKDAIAAERRANEVKAAAHRLLAEAHAENDRLHTEIDRLRVEAARPRRWRDRVRGWWRP